MLSVNKPNEKAVAALLGFNYLVAPNIGGPDLERALAGREDHVNCQRNVGNRLDWVVNRSAGVRLRPAALEVATLGRLVGQGDGVDAGLRRITRCTTSTAESASTISASRRPLPFCSPPPGGPARST